MSDGFQGPSYENLSFDEQREIDNDVSRSIMLIGPQEPLDELSKEYPTGDVYYGKVKYLSTIYKFFRRVRPDGNCFFRGVAFAYMEHLLNNQGAFDRLIEIVESNKMKMMTLDYPDFTLDDIHDGFFSVLSIVGQGGGAYKELYRLFNEQHYSDYVVSYLRLVVSVHLRERESFYKHFMEDGQTVSDFCRRVVEPMNKESDHIHITALSNALGFGIRVRYMDRSFQGGVNAHDFPEKGIQPVVHLLYRPGHYDVLYPKDFL